MEGRSASGSRAGLCLVVGTADRELPFLAGPAAAYATRILLPGPSNGATHPAATPADRVVLAEASRLACGSCHSASETFRTLEFVERGELVLVSGMPEAGRRRGVGRRCGFIGSRKASPRVAFAKAIAAMAAQDEVTWSSPVPSSARR